MNDATLAQMVAALQAENQQLRDWRDSATMSCAKRKCATRERDLREAENERDEANKVCEQWRQWNEALRARVAELERANRIAAALLRDYEADAHPEDVQNVSRWLAVHDAMEKRLLESRASASAGGG